MMPWETSFQLLSSIRFTSIYTIIRLQKFVNEGEILSNKLFPGIEGIFEFLHNFFDLLFVFSIEDIAGQNQPAANGESQSQNDFKNFSVLLAQDNVDNGDHINDKAEESG